MIALTPARRRVLLALLDVYERDGRATVWAVAKAAGLRSPNSVHRHLCLLREDRLVTWVDGQAGTLRPLIVRADGGLWRALPVTRISYTYTHDPANRG